ncbi:MAG: hypothetical protein LBR36_03910 [Bacteroidales bacterium]|nr:hypothetical protein [Bacteroidales bacterium]
MNKTIVALLEEARALENPCIQDVIADLKSRKSICDYVFEKEEKLIWYDETRLLFSKNDSTIEVRCGALNSKTKKWKSSPLISIEFSNISSSRYYIERYPQLVYLLFEKAAQIEVEFNKLKAEVEKQEKIVQLSRSSVKTWLKTVMKDSGYQYYMTNDDNKITLSIRMKHGVQLDIPLYFRRFQKQMPDLLQTIKQYENMIANSKNKVLISNLKANEKWQTV